MNSDRKLIEIVLNEHLVLKISAKSSNSLFEVDDATEHLEARYQLIEGCSYDYAIVGTNSESYVLDHPSVYPSTISRDRGIIAPNIYVGHLIIPVYNELTSTVETTIELEVCSVKTDYRTDYRFMLEYIADKCSDLLFQIDSPVIQNFEVSYEKNGDLIYQRFSFVKAYISSDEFKEAVQSIIKSPTTCWEEEYISTPSSRLSKIGRSESRQIVASSKRLSLCSSHPLYRSGAFSSFPSHIKTKHKRESVDTNENRFVKYVLENLLQFFESCVELFSVYPQSLKEAKYLRDLLAQFLSHNFFKQVGKLTIAHFNSPILQRKYAYKTVLNMWLKFELTSQLTWSGGDDVYQAGKRDVAQLYEYWVFFVLLEIISKHFDIPIQEYESLFNMNNGLSLSLKQGKTTALNGTYNSGSRQFNICLYYNRSFSGGNSFPDAGSWTINMRPDYTLSIWPIELSEKEAEVQEEMVHIHFDAKYKIANAYDLFKADLDLDKEYTENKKGIYKQIDLIKMHAYKDAIRRSEGAYIIYPGDEPKSLKGFHEIIPGLGAFPLKPSLRGEGYSELAVFIESVIQHLKNRASQREHKAYHTYHIYKDSEDNLSEPLPVKHGPDRIIPKEVCVLVGYCRKENIDWIAKEKLYNVRTADSRGSIDINNQLLSSEYLILHTEGETRTKTIYKIKRGGAKIYSQQELIAKGYNSNKSSKFKTSGNPNYLVFRLEAADDIMNTYEWDISLLPEYNSREMTKPKVYSLLDVMKVVSK